MTRPMAATAEPCNAPIGHRADGTPIVQHRGARGTMFVEPDADGEGDEPDGDAEGDSSDGDADYKPPTRAEWERTQAAIKRNNTENRNLRQIKRTLAGKGVDLSSDEGRKALEDILSARGSSHDPKAAATPDRVAIERAVERASAKTEAKFRPVVAELAIKAALVDAGWNGKAFDRIMRQIDLDDMDIVDGKVTGIAEQIDEIKTDIPEWFKPAQTPAERRRGGREVDAGEKPTKQSGSTGTWLDKVDRQMTGG